MGTVEKFKPVTKDRPKPEKPADVVPREEFAKRFAELEIERRNKEPLQIEEIFELINEGKISKERLRDFELEPDLQVALGWVVDLLQKNKKLEQTAEEQGALIEQFESLLKENETTIDRLKKLVNDMEEKFPPLGGA